MRPPLPPDWDRFKIHARCVRSFIYEEKDAEFENEVWETVALHRTTANSLFPNLRKLHWVSNAGQISYASLMLGPNLTELKLTTGIASERKCDGILSAAEYFCPGLESISFICGRYFSVFMSLGLSNLVLSSNRLKSYEADMTIFDEAVVHLVQIQSLKVAKLVVPLGAVLGSMLKEVEEPFFPSIEILHIHIRQLNANFLALLTGAQSARLWDISLSADDPLKAVLIQYLAAMQNKPYTNSLRALTFAFPKHRKLSEGRPPLYQPEYRIDREIFQYIFAFKNLTRLHIVSANLDIDDKLVLRIVNAFPRLWSLRLIPNHYSGRTPQVTIQGIMTIAIGLFDLRFLGIAFDAVSMGGWEIGPRMTYSTRCHKLEVADSPIRSVGPVALFLSAMFTCFHFEIVTSLPDTGDTGDTQNHVAREGYKRLWKQVQEQMVFLAHAREQERRRSSDWPAGWYAEFTPTPEPE